MVCSGIGLRRKQVGGGRREIDVERVELPLQVGAPIDDRRARNTSLKIAQRLRLKMDVELPL